MKMKIGKTYQNRQFPSGKIVVEITSEEKNGYRAKVLIDLISEANTDNWLIEKTKTKYWEEVVVDHDGLIYKLSEVE